MSSVISCLEYLPDWHLFGPWLMSAAEFEISLQCQFASIARTEESSGAFRKELWLLQRLQLQSWSILERRWQLGHNRFFRTQKTCSSLESNRMIPTVTMRLTNRFRCTRISQSALGKD